MLPSRHVFFATHGRPILQNCNPSCDRRGRIPSCSRTPDKCESCLRLRTQLHHPCPSLRPSARSTYSERDRPGVSRHRQARATTTALAREHRRSPALALRVALPAKRRPCLAHSSVRTRTAREGAAMLRIRTALRGEAREQFCATSRNASLSPKLHCAQFVYELASSVGQQFVYELLIPPRGDVGDGLARRRDCAG
jgi:hypothetical protein